MKKYYLFLFIHAIASLNLIAQEDIGQQILKARQTIGVNPEKAIDELGNLMLICESKGLDSLWITSANLLGHIYTQQVSFDKAFDILNQALEKANSKKMYLDHANTTTFLANLYLKVGSYNKAMYYYKDAESKFSNSNYKSGQIKSSTGIGICFMSLSN